VITASQMPVNRITGFVAMQLYFCDVLGGANWGHDGYFMGMALV